MTVEPTTADIVRRLSVPTIDELALSRRRFLQLALGAGAIAMSPFETWDARRSIAAAGGSADGVLVVILLAGGNDGTNMVVPVTDPKYRSLRGDLALDAHSVLPISQGLALHPSLALLKQRYDAGDVAVVQGVGAREPSLSHFESMARWMSGWSGGISGTGWVGRYLSSLPAPDPMCGVVFGPSIPLHFIGPSVSALALQTNASDAVGWLGANPAESDFSTLDLLARFNDRANERGGWADRWNAGLGDMVALGSRSAPIYSNAVPGDDLAANLTLAARLINLGVGTRVIGITVGDFDTHADQLGRHAELLRRLDAGIDSFFAALDPAESGRVTVLTMSEFGRRAQANSSGGTDHGAASTMLAIGGSVRGGVYGATPSMSDLDGDGNLKASVDFRAVFATALSWMDGDATTVLGADYGNLGFLDPPVAGPRANGANGSIIIGHPSAFVAVPPLRVLDTRGDGIGYDGTKPTAGATVPVALSTVPGLPAIGVTAVALNVTATGADDPGYITVWPGGTMPVASNLNLDEAGQTRPNLVSATLGADGLTRVFTSTQTHLVADVFGYYRSTSSASAGRFVPAAPTRLLDTRSGGQVGYVGAKPADASVVTLQVAGRAGLPSAGVAAIVLNVTATDTEGYGYVTVFPDGEAPVASNLNIQRAGATVANQVIVRVGADGAVRLFTFGSAHLVADVVGWFTDETAPASTEGLFTPSSPFRVLDTRQGDECAAGSVLTLPVASPGPPAAGARAIVLNVTAVDAQGWGYVTVFPDGDRPEVSSLNVDGAARTIANHVVCPVGYDGAVRLFTSATMDLVVDVTGWFR
jgi:uncharacterized protein (DUF1501 family)